MSFRFYSALLRTKNNIGSIGICPRIDRFAVEILLAHLAGVIHSSTFKFSAEQVLIMNLPPRTRQNTVWQ